jgi:hypothetical protein
VVTEVEYATDDGFHRACQFVGAEAVGEYFSFRAVFLSGEGEGNGGGCIEFGDRGMEEIEKSIIDVELNVLQTKWGVVRRSTGVLAWSKQKVEGDGDRVGYGFSIFG